MAAGTPRKAAMAKIVEARIFLIQAALAETYRLSAVYGDVTTTQAVLIKLVDADNVVGWGEANPKFPFTAETPREAFDVLRDELLPAVFRQDCPEPGLIDECLDQLRADHLCAKGAVSMALLDIQGKRQGVRVAELLGSILRTSLPVLWPLGNGSAADDISVIEKKLFFERYYTYMLKMGAAPVPHEIKRVTDLEAYLNRHYPDGVTLIADANAGWSRDQTREFLDGTKSSGLKFLEQPVAKEDVEGMALLAQSSPLPISADECLTGLSEARQLARLGAANVFSIKSSKNGGPLRAKRIADVAREHGLLCYMNSMLEFGITQAASLHHAVTVPNLIDVGHAFMSTLRLAEDPTNFSSFVHQGVAWLPGGPGLGIEVDEQHVLRLAVDKFYLNED